MLILQAIIKLVYNGWRERQYEMFDKRELCAKLVKEGAVSQKFCDEEIKYETRYYRVNLSNNII